MLQWPGNRYGVITIAPSEYRFEESSGRPAGGVRGVERGFVAQHS